MAKGRPSLPASLRSQWQWASATQNARMRYAAQLTLGDFELVVNLANYANIDLRTTCSKCNTLFRRAPVRTSMRQAQKTTSNVSSSFSFTIELACFAVDLTRGTLHSCIALRKLDASFGYDSIMSRAHCTYGELQLWEPLDCQHYSEESTLAS